MKIVRFVLMSIFLITACSVIAMKKGSQPNIAKITATAHKKVEAIAQAKTIEQLDKSANDAKSVFGQLRKLNQNEQVAQLENEMQEAMQKAKERFSQTPIQKSRFTTWVNKNKMLLGLLGVSIMSIMYPEAMLPGVMAVGAASYAKLGLLPNAGQAEIAKACRMQKKKLHPDMPGGDAEKYMEIGNICDELKSEDVQARSNTQSRPNTQSGWWDDADETPTAAKGWTCKKGWCTRPYSTGWVESKRDPNWAQEELKAKRQELNQQISSEKIVKKYPEITTKSVKNFDPKATSDLTFAIRLRDFDKIEAAIKAGADINQYQQFSAGRMIPLMYAINNRDYELIESFLKWGANPNAYVDDMPLLYFAVDYHDDVIVRLLLEYGADPNMEIKGAVKGHLKANPLGLLLQNMMDSLPGTTKREADEFIFSALVNYGAKIPNPEKYLSKAALAALPMFVDYLISQGAVPDQALLDFVKEWVKETNDIRKSNYQEVIKILEDNLNNHK